MKRHFVLQIRDESNKVLHESKLSAKWECDRNCFSNPCLPRLEDELRKIVKEALLEAVSDAFDNPNFTKSLKMLDSSAKNLKKGKAGKPIKFPKIK